MTRPSPSATRPAPISPPSGAPPPPAASSTPPTSRSPRSSAAACSRSLPVTESGDLDEAAFTTTVTEAAAQRAEADGAGSIRGFGRSTTTDTNVIAEAEKAAAGAFGRTPKEA